MAAGRRGTLVPLADRARLAGGARHAKFQQPLHGFGIKQIPLQLFGVLSEKRPQRALCNPSIATDLYPAVRYPTLHPAMPDVESLDHLCDRISLLALGAEPQVAHLAPDRLLAPVQLSRDHSDTEMLHGFKKEPHVGVSPWRRRDRKSTRLNSSHRCISYAVFCL